MTTLVANARMYAVNEAVRAAWAALFALVSQRSGVPLTVIDHAAPAPLEELWRRGDLGLAFICGYPFATGDFSLQPVAAPVPASALAAGKPLYATDLIVRADRPLRTLDDSFGGRIGWTARHSQSGFQALRHHLAPYRREGAPLYRESLGDLLTPRRVVAAVLEGRIDIGPLDTFFHDLLKRHETDTAAKLFAVATTDPTPMPLLAASASVPASTVAALRAALLGLGSDPAAHPALAVLCLSGFAEIGREDYAPLLARAAAVDAAGYETPG
jgi:ABC-type phosphate/phosphonate transport system substrate-binding protein